MVIPWARPLKTLDLELCNRFASWPAKKKLNHKWWRPGYVHWFLCWGPSWKSMVVLGLRNIPNADPLPSIYFKGSVVRTSRKLLCANEALCAVWLQMQFCSGPNNWLLKPQKKRRSSWKMKLNLIPWPLRRRQRPRSLVVPSRSLWRSCLGMSLSSAKLGISNMLWVGHMYSVKKHPGGPIDFSVLCVFCFDYGQISNKSNIIHRLLPPPPPSLTPPDHGSLVRIIHNVC